jgi:thiol-disulfide isomerase/thioredoxin
MKILEFSAPTRCHKCKYLAPLLQIECNKYGIDLEFFDIDSDEGYQKSIDRGIKSVPTVIAISDEGKEIGRDLTIFAWKAVEYWYHNCSS